MFDSFQYSYKENSYKKRVLFLQNGYCHSKGVQNKVNITGYKRIPYGDDNAMIAALNTYGPVAVDMDADDKAFLFYSNGVYSNPKCSKYISNGLLPRHIPQ